MKGWSMVMVLALAAFFPGESVDAGTLGPAEVSAVERMVEEYQRSLKDLQAQVEQTVFIKDLGQPVVSRGKLAYSKPGRLRVDYTQPEGDLLLFTPEQVVVKQGEEVNVRRLSGGSAPAMLLDAFEKKPAAWRQDFEVNMERGGGHILVSLTPLKGSKSATLPKEIKVTLDEASWNLLALEIEAEGTQMKYAFSGHRKNEGINQDLFVWKPKP